MRTMTTNIGRGDTGYKLVTTDARDIPAAVTVWLHETAQKHNVCDEAIAVFTGLVVRGGHAGRVEALRAGFNEWLAAKETDRAAYAAKMQEAA